jgi:hypothetical protein
MTFFQSSPADNYLSEGIDYTDQAGHVGAIRVRSIAPAIVSVVRQALGLLHLQGFSHRGEPGKSQRP